MSYRVNHRQRTAEEIRAIVSGYSVKQQSVILERVERTMGTERN
jgi:hypothetical protein